jgi:hypothetical protein
MVLVRPFDCLKNNVLNIYNEGVLLLTFCLLIGVNIGDASDTFQSYVGWLLIVLILFSLLATWGMLLPAAAKDAWDQIKKCFSKAQPPRPVRPSRAIRAHRTKGTRSAIPEMYQKQKKGEPQRSDVEDDKDIPEEKFEEKLEEKPIEKSDACLENPNPDNEPSIDSPHFEPNARTAFYLPSKKPLNSPTNRQAPKKGGRRLA